MNKIHIQFIFIYFHNVQNNVGFFLEFSLEVLAVNPPLLTEATQIFQLIPTSLSQFMSQKQKFILRTITSW